MINSLKLVTMVKFDDDIPTYGESPLVFIRTLSLLFISIACVCVSCSHTTTTPSDAFSFWIPVNSSFSNFDFTALALKESLTPLALTSTNLSHLLQVTMKVQKGYIFLTSLRNSLYEECRNPVLIFSVSPKLGSISFPLDSN